MTAKLKKQKLPEWATLEYDNGILSFNPSNVTLHLEPEQEKSYLSGPILRERLSNEDSLNLACLQYFVDNPKSFREEWKGKYIFGWGTIVRSRYGNLDVPYLIDRDDRVELRWRWLSDDWDGHCPAARFASPLASEPKPSLDSLNLEARVQKLEEIIKHHNLGV